IIGGHWVDPAGDGGKYWWDTIAINDAGRSVHQMFCDYQERDINCTASAATSHVMFLRFLPAWSQMEILVYSVGAGKWVTTGDRTYGTAPTTPTTTPLTFASTPDTTPPSAPPGLSITTVTSSGFALSWAASTDDVAVAGYRIDVATTGDFSA